jgi:2-polyprenyl-3-methyl-5-hydroxy-6-metoxy-1,4-benzoquinol methylase
VVVTDIRNDLTYDELLEEIRRRGTDRLGPKTSWTWQDDPKWLLFALARYKFVSKMIDGVDGVLEVGCGDGFGARIVAQTVRNLVAIDINTAFIESARSITNERYPITFKLHDMLQGPVSGQFGAVYSLDVLEHIAAADEDRFVANAIASLDPHGICIIGMPSVESQAYASKYSKLGHINCKEQPALKAFMSKYFHNVFIFSMNDEIVHTGFSKMSHYNIALCCTKKA